MKRDWALLRDILLRLEEKPDLRGGALLRQFPGYDPEMVAYHTHLLRQAGLTERTFMEDRDSPSLCLCCNLTWAGHELLDAIRDEATFNRIMAVLKDERVGLTAAAVLELSGHIARTLVAK